MELVEGDGRVVTPELADIMDRQSKLFGDVERLEAYGLKHPKDWGGLWFEGARLVISLTRPEEHTAAVRALLEHPNDVDVVSCKRSKHELADIRAAVNRQLERHPGCWHSVGDGPGRVHLDLKASGLDLAERLWDEHGDALLITVAGHNFPLDDRAVDQQPRAVGPEQTAPCPLGLELDVVLDETTTPSGGLITGAVVLRATSHGVELDSEQPLYGELLDRDGFRVNSLVVIRVGTGWRCRLEPSEVRSIKFIATTDSDRLADGPHVPPGTWSLVVPVPLLAWPDGHLQQTQLLAGPVPVVLTTPVTRDDRDLG